LKSGTAIACRFVGRRLRSVNQSELLDAIELHHLWLQADSRAGRAAFAECDLSGLDFLSGQREMVNLRGSDFTEGDLSGIVAIRDIKEAAMADGRLAWEVMEEAAKEWLAKRAKRCSASAATASTC
jgi:uncharacterized protein YjbI with pentapeptide repeats